MLIPDYETIGLADDVLALPLDTKVKDSIRGKNSRVYTSNYENYKFTQSIHQPEDSLNWRTILLGLHNKEYVFRCIWKRQFVAVFTEVLSLEIVHSLNNIFNIEQLKNT